MVPHFLCAVFGCRSLFCGQEETVKMKPKFEMEVILNIEDFGAIEKDYSTIFRGVSGHCCFQVF